MKHKPENGQAGAEIEITPEMIKAGRDEIVGYSIEWESPVEAAKRVFLAMISARQSGPPPNS